MYRLFLTLLFICATNSYFTVNKPHIQSLLFSSNNNNNNDKHQHIIEKFEEICSNLITISKNKYTNGSEYYSNPKSQMGSWIDNTLKEEVIDIFNDLTVNTSNKTSTTLFTNVLDTKNHIYNVDIFHSNNEYTLTLHHIPPMLSTQSYSHEPGTFIAYKAIYGVGYLQTDFNTHTHKSDLLESTITSPTSITNSNSNTRVISRIGGPHRQLINNATASCGILELAIYPPMVKLENTFSKEKRSPCIRFPSIYTFNILLQPYITLYNNTYTDDEKENNIRVMTLSNEEKKSLFQSYKSTLPPPLPYPPLSYTDLNIPNIPTTDELIGQFSTALNPTFPSSATGTTPNPSFGSVTHTNTHISMPSYKPMVDIPVELAYNIGGLESEVKELTRRILYSRRLPPDMMSALGK